MRGKTQVGGAEGEHETEQEEFSRFPVSGPGLGEDVAGALAR